VSVKNYISVELGSLIVAVIAAIGYVGRLLFNRKKRLEKTVIYKTIKANVDIDAMISELKTELTDAVKINLIETTNGGGIPTPSHITYKRVVTSTDPHDSLMFGIKHPNDSFFNKILLNLLVNSFIEYQTVDIPDPALRDYMIEQNITNVFSCYTGIEKGIRILNLSVDFKNNYNLTEADKTKIRRANAKIQKILNKYNVIQ